eukprot:SAG25_NODE_57_length_18482_cov_39.198063_9_plen_94_part_00
MPLHRRCRTPTSETRRCAAPCPPPQKVFWLESPDAALATVTEVEDCTHLRGGGGQELRANVDRDPDRAGSGGVPHAQIALARLGRGLTMMPRR